MKNIIEINNLTKTYGKQRGIEDITLSIQEGEIFGFIGPNGAGKSTTIRCLLSLIYPTGGSAAIFGLDCVKNASEIAKEVGYLPSEVFYYDNMKVKDLLHYSASFYKKDCREKIRELCDVLELDTGRKIEDLSFGNRKKVGIVQGLLHSPKLIILDEPTSGLDPLMQKKFFDLILEENRNGATVFFSSHILSEVQKMCHRVGFIKDGKLIKLDTMASLKEDSYKKIELESREALNPDIFRIKGLSNLKIDNLHASFIYRGNVNRMTHLLNDLSLQDLSVQEPDLEEIFMHYYN